MVDVGCTVYQLLYFVQTPAALGVAEQARAGDVVSGEGFPVNPAEFAALDEVKFRVEDDVYQHFLHLRDGDAFEAVQRGFGGESMQDDAAGGAAELEELFPGRIGKDRQAWIFLPERVREGLLQKTLYVHDDHVDIGHMEHEWNDVGCVPDAEIGQRVALPEVCAHLLGLRLQGEEVPGLGRCAELVRTPSGFGETAGGYQALQLLLQASISRSGGIGQPGGQVLLLEGPLLQGRVLYDPFRCGHRSHNHWTKIRHFWQQTNISAEKVSLFYYGAGRVYRDSISNRAKQLDSRV